MLLDNRRKLSNYLIEPKFQLRYIGLLIASSLVPIVVCVGVIAYFLHQNYLLLDKYISLDPEITSLLMWEMKFLFAVIGISFSFFFVAVSAIGIIFSHRIAGVIYKTRKTCNEIKDGKPSQLSFRDKDEFQGLAKDFNAMLLAIRASSTTNRAKRAS